MDFKSEVVKLLVKETGLEKDNLATKIEVPPNPKLGDFAFPCFELAKVFKKNPVQIAQELAGKLEKGKLIKEIKAVGPYLNFFVNLASFAEDVLEKINKEKSKYGWSKDSKETVMVEFFHANTHKGVHIGHIRNISTGSSICNILEAVGNKVLRVNYQGDIGPHVAKCIWGYLHFKEKEPTKNKGVWLGKIYARATQEVEKNPNYEEEVKELNTKIYKHDKEIDSLWIKTRQWCLEEFDKFYKEFGVKYKRFYFESEAEAAGRKEMQKLLEMGVARKDEGAIIVDLEKYGLGKYVGITSQGNPTYHAKDLGLANLKIKEFKFDKSLHVVGSEQELYFKQIFKTFELMKSPLANKSTHISYGLVMLPEGKMSSRLGNMVLYDNLIEELMTLSKNEIKKRHVDLSEKEIEKRAKSIAFGALKYSMVSRENNKSLVFDWERALDFEGETGPYIQYAHARCSSIIKKAGKVSINGKLDLLNTEAERNLISNLSLFGDVVKDSAQGYKPYVLARYLLDLAQMFNGYYHAYPVISENKELMKSRLMLVKSVKQVLANGLNLLGIEAPEVM